MAARGAELDHAILAECLTYERVGSENCVEPRTRHAISNDDPALTRLHRTRENKLAAAIMLVEKGTMFDDKAIDLIERLQVAR